MTINTGDWVAFLKDGQMVIGQVLYCVPSRNEVITTAGVASSNDGILECRPAKNVPAAKLTVQ